MTDFINDQNPGSWGPNLTDFINDQKPGDWRSKVGNSVLTDSINGQNPRDWRSNVQSLLSARVSVLDEVVRNMIRAAGKNTAGLCAPSAEKFGRVERK